MQLKQAFFASPGPQTKRDALVLAIKGVCMGVADIIPGVSGGTIAFITGIYEDLIAAIKSFDLTFFKRVLTLQFASALSEVHLRFLVSLLCGIGIAVVAMSRVMHYLMQAYPVAVWSFFFGLIGASIVVVGGKIGKLDVVRLLALLIGAVAGFIIVGMIPVYTPETLGFIFFSGALAICAMILPGISGAFILLLLGKYEFITGALKHPFNGENGLIILVFVAGCVLGIMGFSRLLNYFLKHHHSATLAVLTGFMIGSLRKIWPFKEVLETTVIRNKVYVLREQNILPGSMEDALMAAGLIVVGFCAVYFLERRMAKPGNAI
ncbi:DUF368 domain-containing protein [Desulfovibrio inopinatus]|uniref:DUF368 domain-containing protein n=1 Tax=Desulfovibrio inopinatus TaxID=102109 RepID=UPI000421A3F0|nr:DUF368 domain-containing protein [Desulfovibrio inopinatus]